MERRTFIGGLTAASFGVMLGELSHRPEHEQRPGPV